MESSKDLTGADNNRSNFKKKEEILIKDLTAAKSNNQSSVINWLYCDPQKNASDSSYTGIMAPTDNGCRYYLQQEPSELA